MKRYNEFTEEDIEDLARECDRMAEEKSRLLRPHGNASRVYRRLRRSRGEGGGDCLQQLLPRKK